MLRNDRSLGIVHVSSGLKREFFSHANIFFNIFPGKINIFPLQARYSSIPRIRTRSIEKHCFPNLAPRSKSQAPAVMAAVSTMGKDRISRWRRVERYLTVFPFVNFFSKMRLLKPSWVSHEGKLLSALALL